MQATQTTSAEQIGQCPHYDSTCHTENVWPHPDEGHLVNKSDHAVMTAHWCEVCTVQVGAALSMVYTLALPLLFVGCGQT